MLTWQKVEEYYENKKELKNVTIYKTGLKL